MNTIAFLAEQPATNWIDKLFSTLYDFATTMGFKVIGALLVLLIGSIVVSRISKRIRRSKKTDSTLAHFLASFVNFGGKTLVVIIAISILGVEMSSIVALIASAGVAIGLALQGSLSNIAGGILLIVFKPFKVGDYIMVGGEEGTVRDMNLFYTILKKPDNTTVSLPNTIVSNSSLKNISTEETRRVDFALEVAYGTDVEYVKKLLITIANNHDLVMKDPAPFCRLSAFNANGLGITLRVWTKKEDYWTVNFDLKEDIEKAFTMANIEIPYNKLDVNLVGKTNDAE